MAAQIVTKLCREQLCCSTVDWRGARQMFAVATPRSGSPFDQQAEEALRLIEAAAGDMDLADAIVQQTVFLADAAHTDRCREMVRRFYGDRLPATTYVPQPPCSASLLSIEAVALGGKGSDAQIERLSEQLVVARHNGIAWLHCAQAVAASHAASAHEEALDTLGQLRSLLESAGADFGQVIRTWFYLGGIVAQQGPHQRYKELNRGRDDFYKDISFLAQLARRNRGRAAYPASTGIGKQGGGLIAGALAVTTDRDDVLAVPLENPRQTSAYDYAAVYSPSAPRFSRAMALLCGPQAVIFVSGTASTTNPKPRHADDAVAQTEETLDNINALVCEENLYRHGLSGFGTSLEGLALARVYIKRKEDYPRVSAVCQKRLGGLPTVFVVADVCRPELLVEIEAVAFSRTPPSSGALGARSPIMFSAGLPLPARHDFIFVPPL
jgi:enamine deaminase RidA (YjgF/YER057c/UK114 family)